MAIQIQKGDEAQIEEKNGKFYLKTMDGTYLSNNTVLGSSGNTNKRKYVFSSMDDALSYLNAKGFYEAGKKPVEEEQEVVDSVEGDEQEVVVDDSTQNQTEEVFEPFVPTTPNTTPILAEPGEVVTSDPGKPRVVIQPVTPPTYNQDLSMYDKYKADAETALKIATGILEYDPRFDVDGDGKVTSADALAVHKGEHMKAVPLPKEGAEVGYPGGMDETKPGFSVPPWLIAPPPDAIVTQAAESFTNPNTGETVMVPTGGYRLNQEYLAKEKAAMAGPEGVTPGATTVIGQPDSQGGTYTVPAGGATESAVPKTLTYKTSYTGTQGNVAPELVNTMPGTSETIGSGVKDVMYSNKYGAQMMITEMNGKPIIAVPPGFTRMAAGGYVQQQGYAEGGDVMGKALLAIAKVNGYTGSGDPRSVKAFMSSTEGLKAKARAVGVAMARGGVVYANEGVDNSAGSTEEEQEETVEPNTFTTDFAEQAQDTITQTMTPRQSTVAKITPTAADMIPDDAGQLTPQANIQEAAKVEEVTQADVADKIDATTYSATTSATDVKKETDALTAAEGEVSEEAKAKAATMTAADSELMNSEEIKAQKGTSIDVEAPAAREIEKGELIDLDKISGQAEKAAKFAEQIQYAEATPSKQATVAGQLDNLMADFEGGQTPPWAAGAMRAATATMAARGLGASSMAGQAIIQAAMESALPIAQADAATNAQFEAQNLSNRQSRMMLAAQQRAQFIGQEFDQTFQARVINAGKISDVANMNFTAEQQIALENSRAANTMELANLSNSQAVVMAKASALANMDMANLSNLQQAAVQQANAFLQMDMANLNNEQQTSIFKSQQNIQALFNDQAAENASRQFNAASQTQTDQFFANLETQVNQFNSSQSNAIAQFNVDSVNAMRQHNSSLQEQRDQFNAKNGLVVAQANAAWRQNIATINTAAQNQSNAEYARTMNNMTSKNIDEYWQRERDIMSYSFTSAENSADRISNVLIAEMTGEQKAAYADAMGKGTLTATLAKGAMDYITKGI